jgi:formyl-CoA transferase
MSGRRDGHDMQNLHRNKRSLTLDLKSAEGRAIFYRLVERADVVVENYRPDVKSRLGIDFESLRQVNRRIILASVSGFGQDGPYANRPGFDQIAQGMGGFMSVTGAPGQGPMRAGAAIADVAAGLYAALGVFAALVERETSGEGQWVQSSLLMAQIALMDFPGGALPDRRRGPRASRQRPSDDDADVDVSHERRLGQHRSGGQRDLGAARQRARPARSSSATRVRRCRGALGESRAIERCDR